MFWLVCGDTIGILSDNNAGLFYFRLSGRIRGPLVPADWIGIISQSIYHVYTLSTLVHSNETGLSTLLAIHAALLVLLVVGVASKYIRF